MTNFIQRYLDFIRGVSVNWIGRLGVILTTSSFITMILLQLAGLIGIITSAYVGLVTYLLIPSLFIIGLILIPIGWYRLKKKTGKSSRELLETRFDVNEVDAGFFGSKIIRTVGLLTLVNILFLSIISARMLAFMDEPHFCGTACHSVMDPEWVTYQQSPHAHVKCVQCHVGEGAEALINSKLNGMYQILSVTFDLLQRPIPTPVRQLRPARETCEKCHWPDKFYGNHLKTTATYDSDEASSPRYTTLNLKIDAGKGGTKAGIHWHVAAQNEIRFASLNDKREDMLWVEVHRSDGRYDRYQNIALSNTTNQSSRVRVMDCVDCHNRVTHIYEQPEAAIDNKIHLGSIDRSLPYIKREGLAAISGNYPDQTTAAEVIKNHLHGFYTRSYPSIEREKAALIDSVAAVLQSIYARNIHPEMNITWNSYPDHRGHRNNPGCFRCHNPQMVDQNGKTIADDCTLCHSILANDDKEPFHIFQPIDTATPEYPMQIYLRDEFLNSYSPAN